MRTPLFIGITCVVLTACELLTTSDVQDSRGNPHTVTVNWTIRNADGSVGECPANFPNIKAISLPNDPSSLFTEPESALVPCTPTGSASIEVFTSGELYNTKTGEHLGPYTPLQYVNASVSDETGTIFLVFGLGSAINLTRDTAVDVSIYPTAGFSIITWLLNSGLTGQQTKLCEAVSVDTIEVRYRPFDDENAPLVTDSWPCTTVDVEDALDVFGWDVGNGLTRALPVGNYIGEMAAMRGNTELITVGDVQFEIRAGNDITDYVSETLTIPDR